MSKKTWSEAVAEIHQKHPEVNTLNWKPVFLTDPALLGRVISDMLKMDLSESSRPGKQSKVDPEEARRRMRRYGRDDYTMLPFSESVSLLKGDLSVRAYADKCGMHYSRLYTLLCDRGVPSLEEMQKVAKAHGKDPSFFLEYRIATIFACMAAGYREYPESTVPAYLKVTNANP